jgi:hypothetical protein
MVGCTDAGVVTATFSVAAGLKSVTVAKTRNATKPADITITRATNAFNVLRTIFFGGAFIPQQRLNNVKRESLLMHEFRNYF